MKYETVYQTQSALNLCYEAKLCIALLTITFVTPVLSKSGTYVVPLEEGNLCTWEGGVLYLDGDVKPTGTYVGKLILPLLRLKLPCLVVTNEFQLV